MSDTTGRRFRLPNPLLWSSIAIALFFGSLVVSLVGFVYCRYADWWDHPDPIPIALSYPLGPDASRISSFHQYDLGGFIDHEWLWRIDAEPGVVAIIVSKLALHRTDIVSPAFLRMPPYYWPRSVSNEAEAFQSSDFHAGRRGPDGEHYFLLYDTTQNRAFVWYKSNF